MKQRFRNLPIDVWFEPLVFIVLAVGYFSWYATTTFTETEQASLGWSTLQSTIIDHIELTLVAAIVVIVIALSLIHI